MAVSSGTAVLTLPSDTQILMTREFDAPKHLVFEAYTKPEHVRRWWAGRNGEVTSCEVDLRVGGTWRYVMVTSQGGFEVAFHGEFQEIVPDERIVTTEVFEGMPDGTGGGEVLTTVTFTEVGGRTTLQMLTDCDSTETRDAILATGMEDGAQGSLDALERVAVELRRPA
jgi:uncharacterized protein YndB with AHSA1/START domain